MQDMLKSVDPWFLNLSVLLLSGYFLWSIRNIFTGFKEAVEKLANLIDRLYEKHDDHETRISNLEGRCGIASANACGGRRFYDPNERPHQ